MTELDTVDIAAALLRFVAGLAGGARVQPSVGPGGLAGTTRWFGSLGLRPPKLHAVLSGVRELAVGTALAIRLLTPLTAAFVVGTMVAAGVTAHRRNGFVRGRL